jgi:hypothetical protein
MMTTRIELDFRYGLTEPRLEQVPDGARLTLTRGQEQLVVFAHARAQRRWLDHRRPAGPA